MEYKYDFERIKAEVSVPMVLAFKNITLKPEADHFRGACPFQDGHGKTAFIAWERGWKCHSCGKKGDVLRLVMDLEGLSRDDPKSAPQAGKLIYEWFGLNGETQKPPVKAAVAETIARVQDNQSTPEPLVNPPLKFTLKDVNPDHPYLLSRGFQPGHAEYLGAGYFPGKGSMAGRFIFPIANSEGQLVSYAGRLVDDSQISDENPRWRLGKGFRKNLELYNLHRVLRGDFQHVVVCEGFWQVMACVRAGVMNAIATMGHDLSDEQAKLLGHFQEITLLYDGDEPGRKGSQEVGTKLLTLNVESVRVLFLPEDAQPDTLAPDDLYTLLM